MTNEQYWHEINKANEKVSNLMSKYWYEYSGINSWQFWVILASAIIPLIILYFKVDRSRIFEIFFFGYTVNQLWAYVEIILARGGYLVHTYFLVPFAPSATNITASILPVGFLLVYQYCTKYNKNFYFYTVLLSATFSFMLAPLEKHFHLLELGKGFNFFYIFLFDLIIVFGAYWLTKLILHMSKTARKE